MAPQTQLTKSQLDTIARAHQEVGSSIGRQQTTLRGNIDTLAAANAGEMINKLKQTHESWQTTCASVVKNLNAMADAVTTAGSQYQNKDSDVGASVGAVRTPDLAGFIAG